MFFPWKFFLYNILSIDHVSISDLLYFSRYETILVFKFLCRHVINFRIYLQSTLVSSAKTHRAKQREEGNKKN